MRIVRTVAKVLLTIAVVLFAVANWRPVEVTIWEGLILETKLPVLVIAAFLLGLVPTWVLYRATLARIRRQRAMASAVTADGGWAAAPPDPRQAP